MTNKYALEDLKEFSKNPFVNYKSGQIFDKPFIDDLSKDAKHLIKYLIYKQAFTEGKFLFSIDEFNKFIGHMNMANLSDGLAELCTKELLAKTKDTNIYWVNKDNKDMFNTRVFEPKHRCAQKSIALFKLESIQTGLHKILDMR